MKKAKTLLRAGILGTVMAFGTVPMTAVLPVSSTVYADSAHDLLMQRVLWIAVESVTEVLEKGMDIDDPNIKPQVVSVMYRRIAECGCGEGMTDELISNSADNAINTMRGILQQESCPGGNCSGQPQGNAPTADVPQDNGGSFSSYAEDLLSEVNRNRSEYGLEPLVLAADLCYSADIRAREIVTVFSHTRPDGTPCYTAIQSSYSMAAENIAGGLPTAAQTVEQWMNSPGHRANILNPELRELGVGYCYEEASEYKHYWVQLFRTR